MNKVSLRKLHLYFTIQHLKEEHVHSQLIDYSLSIKKSDWWQTHLEKKGHQQASDKNIFLFVLLWGRPGNTTLNCCLVTRMGFWINYWLFIIIIIIIIIKISGKYLLFPQHSHHSVLCDDCLNVWLWHSGQHLFVMHCCSRSPPCSLCYHCASGQHQLSKTEGKHHIQARCQFVVWWSFACDLVVCLICLDTVGPYQM